MKKILLAALLGAVAAPALAQAPAAAKAPTVTTPAATPAPRPNIAPAMWVVKDADTTIYLFGTFHLLDGKSDWFNDEVKTAFDASQEVYLEAIIPEDMAALQPLIAKYAVDPKGRTLSSRLPKDVKTKLDTVLTGAGIPQGAFEPLEPWFVGMTLTSLAGMKIGITGEHGPEKVISAAAKARGIKVGELESADFQLAMLDGLPEADQIAQLSEAVEKFETIGEEFRPMMAAWSSGDTESLVRILNEGMADKPALYKTIFSDRNANWAKWIDTRLDTPGTVFVAVGAGHLAGKDSVQQLLAAQGIKAEKVKPAG